MFFTRSRPYHKNDNAHVEQRNSTHIRAQFGHERYDNPEVVAHINALCKGPLGQMNNHFLSTLKLKEKRRREKKITRIYGPAQTAYERVLEAPQVERKIKAQLRAEHSTLNPFQLAREIEAAKKTIEACRRLRA